VAYTALLDANVLYPAPVRDVLLQLAVTDRYRARWSADIHSEWIEALKPHGTEAQDPDTFLLSQLDLAPGVFCQAIGKIRARLNSPPYTVEQYLATLSRCGLVRTAAELQQFTTLL